MNPSQSLTTTLTATIDVNTHNQNITNTTTTMMTTTTTNHGNSRTDSLLSNASSMEEVVATTTTTGTTGTDSNSITNDFRRMNTTSSSSNNNIGNCSNDHDELDTTNHCDTTTSGIGSINSSGWCSYHCIRSCYSHRTDEELLIIAFVSFISFATLQMIFAIYIAHSHAMIGDSSVMMVDAMTYLFNGWSERKKKYYRSQYESQIQSTPSITLPVVSLPVEGGGGGGALVSQQQQLTGVDTNTGGSNSSTMVDEMMEPYEQHQQEQVQLYLELRKKIILLEIVAPTISVTTLMIITVLITKQALETIQQIDNDTNNTNNNSTEPNLYIILSFSIFNLLLDGINMYFFTRPKLPLLNTTTSWFSCCRRFRRPTAIVDDNNNNTTTNTTTTTTIDTDGIMIQPQSHQHDHSKQPQQQQQQHPYHHSHSHTGTTTGKSSTNVGSTTTTTTNLNMCSAYTHVLADTLRSLAVITAVLLALMNDIEPALADATAALIVSFLIALSLIPLLQGLYNNTDELYRIYKQQRQDERVRYSTSVLAITEASHNTGTNNFTLV